MAFGVDNSFSNEQEAGFKPLEAKKPVEEAPVIEKTEAIKQEPIAPKTENEPILKPLQPKVEDIKTAEQELNEDQVKAYLKNKYAKDREFESLEELFKSQEPTIKEVEKIVNPYEDVLDAEDKAYLEFKKETGRGRKEFEFLSQDINKLSPIDLSRDKIRQETGLPLTNAEADEYLENTLGVVLDDELSSVDKIKLNQFVKSYKDSLIQQQEKYRKPIELESKKIGSKVEMVQLENGQEMPKAEYERLLNDRKVYVEAVEKAVNSVASFDFKITIDDNGEKRDLDLSYELSKEDKHSMLSDTLDLDATVKKRFQTKDGFNHSELAKTLYRGDEANFHKIMTAVAEKARAATIEELRAEANNENFALKPIQRVKTGKEGYGEFPTGERKPGFGVKFG